jgi:hypothetical protein
MAELLHFKPDEILLSDQEVLATLNFFFPSAPFKREEINHEIRSFAQALLVEAVDRSYEMAFIEILKDVFLYRPVVDFVKLKSMVESFLKKAAKHWFKHFTGDIRKLKIYEAVRLKIIQNFRSTVEIYRQTGGLTY